MSAAVELRGVVKRYRRTRALDGLDLRVPRGTLVGLVGPNGAGKTTTFGIISGVLEPDEGTVDVLGSGPFHPRAQAGIFGGDRAPDAPGGPGDGHGLVVHELGVRAIAHGEIAAIGIQRLAR